MPSRLFGAVLALIAALLLGATIMTSALWHGHPSRDGKVMDRKIVSVGMLGADGCNVRDTIQCGEPVPLIGIFPTLAKVDLGLASLLIVLLLALSGTSFARNNARKALGKVAIVTAIVTAAVTLTLIIVGPSFESGHYEVPIGFGMFLLGGALLLAIVGGVLAPKDDRPPTLRANDPFQPVANVPPTAAPPVDVLALLHAPEPPVPQRPMGMPPSPGGMLPGPGPLGASSGPPSAATLDLRPKTASVVPPLRVRTPSMPPSVPPAVRPKPPSISPPAFSMPKLPGMPPSAVASSLPGLPPRPAEPPSDEIMTDRTDVVPAHKTDDVPAPDHRESASDLAETTARPKMDPSELAELEAKVPVTTAPENLEPPKEDKSTAGTPQPACPQCEAPMSWVEEHLRFYCKSCRMYF